MARRLVLLVMLIAAEAAVAGAWELTAGRASCLIVDRDGLGLFWTTEDYPVRSCIVKAVRAGTWPRFPKMMFIDARPETREL